MTAPDHALGTAVNTPTATSLQHVQSSITSDAASESTFAPSYREPEFLDSVAQDYNLCNSQPGFHFDLGDNTPYYGLHPTATYFHPDSISDPIGCYRADIYTLNQSRTNRNICLTTQHPCIRQPGMIRSSGIRMSRIK